MRHLLQLLPILFFITGNASAQDTCSHYYKQSGFYDYYRQDAGMGVCYLNIVVADGFQDRIYRSYLLANDGLLMIFNSYGEGPTATMTGARVFYFFPRNRIPSGSHDSEKLNAQSSNSKLMFSFDAVKGGFLNITEGQVIEDKKISRENNGGIEFKNLNFLHLDLGFAMGHDPSTEPDRKVFFQDEKQTRCSLHVKEIFKLTPDGDSLWIYPDDSSLKKFLNKKCPQLSTATL